MKLISKTLIILLLLITTQSNVFSQNPKTRILFLLDGSGSMWGLFEKEVKIDVAKRLLTKLVDSISQNKEVEMALRAYGHVSPKVKQDCKDTRLEVPFGPDNKDQIIARLKEIRPKGTTPIAYSLSVAANDFPRANNVRNIIILITDGIEECGGDPCQVSLSLQKRGIMLKPFIIGLGINEDLISQLDCAGNFFNATDENSFEKILNVVISNALNNTTAQVNLLDSYGKATETDVDMTFYESKKGMIMYNFYHTLNDAGLPDTLFIDPFMNYNLVVHTLPPVTKENISLNHGKHNIIAVNAPQGYLNLVIKGITQYKNLIAVVKKAGGTETVYAQEFNTLQKYLVGRYDLEILSLPRIYVKDVEIKQSSTTTIEVEQPGKIVIYSSTPMIGSIFRTVNGKLEWVTNLDDKLLTQVLIMQPGTYILSYRRKNARSTFYTNDKEFVVSSGTSLSINLK
ncbi:MAG TPA: VWA domain-containing protein [Bacteroidia bacterium]|nr:VWA domain-containing protein [Sphingobacteriales bacterium]HPD65854.1 VWA domain-containing protein [Bacteroidia bacterium]HRS59541.1 VWA domain-containing protein [Bacteroidia bacterium]HRU67669.1 VWA domain-containing protein [Bacteroidia bacterium]